MTPSVLSTLLGFVVVGLAVYVPGRLIERSAGEMESCPVCHGILSHVLGCPEADRPRRAA